MPERPKNQYCKQPSKLHTKSNVRRWVMINEQVITNQEKITIQATAQNDPGPAALAAAVAVAPSASIPPRT